jgi:AcrR family transcriptional regulator
MGRRSDTTAAETRQRLLDAAMRVMLAKGFQGARVSEIAKEAGVTPGAIYSHFDSKDDLLASAIREQSLYVVSDAGARSGGASSTLAAFKEFARLLTAGMGPADPILLELVSASTRDAGVADTVGREFTARELDTLNAVRAAQYAGEIDPDLDPKSIVRVTTMLTLGARAVNAINLSPVDQSDWAEVVDRLLTSITPQEKRQ